MSINEFEKEYLALRAREGRLHDDDTVKRLPFVDDPEWKIRANSAKKLLDHLKQENVRSFIEVGCGNGWLTNYLQRELNVSATGIDVNKTELEQASRISEGRATFIYGDIFSDAFNDIEADVIIHAASIQYFSDPKLLMERLRPKGTIHILDSPIYETGAAIEAKERSKKYFDSKDAPGMDRFYFHHEMDQFRGAEFLYKPNKIKKLLGGSPFPWLRIRKG